jgi:hypothetical protein
MLKPALIGGVILGILSSLPIVMAFNCVCCAWVIGGGVLAAYLYVKDASVPVTLGRGVALGLLTGAIGALVTALFSIPLYILSHGPGAGFMEQMRQSIDQMPNLPPESRQFMHSLYSGNGMSAVLYAFGFLFMLFVYSLFGMLGGSIGVAIFEKRKPGESPAADLPPYQPPSGMPPPPPPTPPDVQ